MSPHRYEIRVAEELDARWAAWFAGMEILPGEPGNAMGENQPPGTLLRGTTLRGTLADQAALFGLLGQVRDLNLTLLEVRRV